MMDGEDLILVLIPLAIIGFIALWLVGIVPTWLIIQGSWTAFPWWFSISVMLSRIFSAILCILYLLLTLTGKITYLAKGLNAGILAVWGYPVYRTVVMQLAFNELSGLSLQRAIIVLITIETLAIGISIPESANNQEGRK